MIREWKPEYSVGHRRIDSQHRQILDVIAKLSGSFQDKRFSAEAAGIIASLSGYVDTHFRDEEKSMEKSGYPGLEEQRAAHLVFKNKIREFQRDLKDQGEVSGLNLFNFLWDWFTDHILTMDMRFKGRL